MYLCVYSLPRAAIEVFRHVSTIDIWMVGRSRFSFVFPFFFLSRINDGKPSNLEKRHFGVVGVVAW